MATNSTVNSAPVVSEQEQEYQILKLKRESAFELTPVGQQLRQFSATQRMAAVYAKSGFIPDSYKFKNGQLVSEDVVLANCTIALDMATRMGANPLMVMQNLYIVHGQPSFSSKFLIACINSSKRFSPLRYEFRGEENTDDYACRVVAYEANDTKHKDPLAGDWISIGMAKAEGWMNKKGSKWMTMPSQMLRYRAAAFWQRTYCPEISMGLITSEEVNDSYVPYEDMNETKAQDVETKMPNSISGLASLAAMQASTEGAPSEVEEVKEESSTPATETIEQEDKPSLL